MSQALHFSSHPDYHTFEMRVQREFLRVSTIIDSGNAKRIDSVMKYLNYNAWHEVEGEAAKRLEAAGLIERDENDLYRHPHSPEFLEWLAKRHAAVEKHALQDLALARKAGVISIVHTKIGVVELRYNAKMKNYTLSNPGPTAHVITHASSGMVDFLSRYVYQIVAGN